MGNLSHGATLAMWDHIHVVLPATRHKLTRPAITQPIYLTRKDIEGSIDLGSLIAARPGIEPTTA